MPWISVIMPVFNAEDFLEDAIQSILDQSFADFEFLIFNDGSTDRSLEIINSFKDPRIILFDSPRNFGYVKWLNEGIKKAKGKYIARIDADDIADHNRLDKQYQFMESNPEYIICGSNYRIIGDRSVSNLPLEDSDIRLRMLRITPFCHPSVMLRTSVLHEYSIFYNSEHMPSEDHEMWVFLSDYGKFKNLPEPLLYYRVHQSNISLKARTEKQLQNLVDAQLLYIEKFFVNLQLPHGAPKSLHRLFFAERAFSKFELRECGELVDQIIKKKSTYPAPTVSVHQFLGDTFFYRCTTSTSIGLQSFILANRYPWVKTSFFNRTKLLIKALLRH
ncbi:hypothetical protein WSM22_13450 [Cytophagales bacterium WSM2-2]|nr:hypothetical protein WSM22_13450 [Cytophagales bacterium WSM2-2]